MQLSINGKQHDLGAAFWEYIEAHLPLVVDRYLENSTEGHETMSKQGHEVRTDVTVNVGKGVLLQGHAEAGDAYAVLDQAVEHVGKRLRRYKRRLCAHLKNRPDTADVQPALQYVFEDPDLSLKASTGLTWVMLIVYGVWHAAPFSFVVFYAGLQTLPMDTIESAKIDGASRLQQVWYVVIPHLMPLITFVALMQLMDNFRVFEPIVGFSAEAHAQSLSWFIFNDLGGETRLLSSAATSSVLTIIGVSILLFPVLIRTWRDFNEKSAK